MRRKFGRLVISNTIEPGDSGMYTCLASNTYGTLNHTVLLTVLRMCVLANYETAIISLTGDCGL